MILQFIPSIYTTTPWQAIIRGLSGSHGSPPQLYARETLKDEILIEPFTKTTIQFTDFVVLIIYISVFLNNYGEFYKAVLSLLLYRNTIMQLLYNNSPR